MMTQIMDGEKNEEFEWHYKTIVAHVATGAIKITASYQGQA